MFTRAGQPTGLGCGTVCGGGVREGTVLLVQLYVGFQSLPLLPTIKLGPSGAETQVGGFAYVLRSCGPSKWSFLKIQQLFPSLQLPLVFTARGFEAFFSHAGTLGFTVCLPLYLFLPVYLHANMGPIAATSTPTGFSSQRL